MNNGESKMAKKKREKKKRIKRYYFFEDCVKYKREDVGIRVRLLGS